MGIFQGDRTGKDEICNSAYLQLEATPKGVNQCYTLGSNSMTRKENERKTTKEASVRLSLLIYIF
jgi:hypothetical protein